jgi:hypothetical protein
VYVNVQHLRQFGYKLAQAWVGPVTILESLGRNNYRLGPLPVVLARMHDVYHTSFLKPYNAPQEGQDSLPQPGPVLPGTDIFEPEAITGHKQLADGSFRFLVKWKGWDNSFDTYEPIRNHGFRSSVSHY